MRDLQELQRNFQNYLLKEDPLIQAEINSTAKVSMITRLEIYRDAYYLRLLEALQQDYPVLHQLIGCDQFNLLGRQYIDVYPSKYRSIRWFGNELANFIIQTKLYQPWLREMAEFEWLLMEAFDAEDSSLVTIDDMATISPDQWPNMHFRLHPSVRRINLHWNIVPIWKACKKEQKCTPAQQSETPISWMIWRREYDIQFSSLSLDETYMIEAMNAGESFASICEGLCEWVDEENVSMHAALLLKRYIMDNLIVQIEFQQT